MKYHVKAEMRATFDVGTFEADSADEAMDIALQSDRYFRLSRMPGMGGVYDLTAKIDDVPSNAGLSGHGPKEPK